MDINIVNTILRLCFEQQTCLFEVPILSDYCLEQHLCTNSKHVLASVKNYMEIFKISRDRNRIEFFMPFEICRNNYFDNTCQNNGEICSNLHVCYDYFYTNSCRRSSNCPYPHLLIERIHKTILGSLTSLDLDVLTKAFRVYCQSKKHLLNYNTSNMSSSKNSQPTPSSSSINNNNSTTSSTCPTAPNAWRLPATPHINGNSSWKTNNRTNLTSKILPVQQTKNHTPDKGLQIRWTPLKDIQSHFVEVVFSNQGKSNGGPIRTHTTYQHLGIAQVFYQNLDITERVIRHGPITFQSFTFVPRLLQRTIDMRHICLSNISIEITHIPLYINTVSMPYKINRFEFYQNDKKTILVEYNEDIDFSKILSNVRNYPECHGLAIKCIQLYHPETLFIEYDHEYDIKKLFSNEKVFHIKTYPFCAFVHFFSHDDLMRSIKTSLNDSIRMTPIYIDIYSQQHLDNYLQRRQMEFESMKNSLTPSINETEVIQNIELPEKIEPLLPVITNGQIDIPSEIQTEEEISLLKTPETIISNHDDVDEDDNIEIIDNDIQASDDDFHDLPSEFDDNDLFLDESIDNNGDMEFLRSAAKNLMSSLSEMEEASSNTNAIDAPHSLLYGDDYIVTIKSRRFALAFLDYTQFRVEKQRNPDKFRLLSSLKKQTAINQNKRKDNQQRDDDTSSPISNIDSDLLLSIETKSNKKKRHRKNKKKKNMNNNDHKDQPEPTPDSANDNEEDDNDGTSHVLNFPTQRLPHVYLDDDLKPCIVVAGEEHHEENGHDANEHDDWHDIKAGGKQVPVSKKSKKRKQHQQEKLNMNIIEQHTLTPIIVPTVPHIRSQSQANEYNSLIIPINCRGFIHNPKLYETFRLRLRRSFPSINIHFQSDTYTIIIDGNIKPNVQQCLHYLNSFQTHKHSLLISYENFPQTTITNVMRMQQSTAQVRLINHANYNRIFCSTYRLIDFHLKQQSNPQQCIYCRRSKKKFQITYLEFPCDKQPIKEINSLIQERVLQLLNTRFTYIAIALSADLMRTKRWAGFYKRLSEHKDINKTLLIRKINTIIQVYGLHAHVQQIQTLLTKFLDDNRYETDVIETEQASGIFALFKNDFHEMENLDIFREAELHFVYYHHRHVLLFQCFQEKFEMVKNRIEKMRGYLSTIILPVKSPILSRYYSKSNEMQRIGMASSCMITTEQRIDHNRPNDYLINLKIISRSSENTTKAQKLIKEFEEQKYSTRKIHNHDIHLFTEQDIAVLQKECNTCHVSCKIDQGNNIIELEGLSGDFIQIEKLINDLCLISARRALDDIQYSTQWIYYDAITNRPVAFGEIIKQQLEKCYLQKQRGLVNLKDHTGHIRTFDLDKMIEIIHGNNPNLHSTDVKIERRDFKNPQSIQLPPYWTPMTKPWERILLGRRENITEWKANNEIQKLLRLPHMLPEPWLIEIHRIQNPRMFQQYMTHKDNFAARSQANERILYRLAQVNLIDDMCAHGFNRSHTDSAFSAYGHGCHFYCKAIDIDRTATLLAKNFETNSILSQQQTPSKPPVRFLFICKVLVGRYTRGDASMKTCPPGYDSLVNDTLSPEVFVTHHDAQVLPEYLIAYQSAIF
ncbi:unnamed protein product [Adineta steineri]|uniref:C3H1-type domain-containing protein n=1 Tax=Adineta steineri TaxID=433720 RepID=A0A819KLR5_9BILA|nr:unnamed protein product [Adineta steineri]CAF3949108.1 unnamed protein product [Adineta steineri]